MLYNNYIKWLYNLKSTKLNALNEWQTRCSPIPKDLILCFNYYSLLLIIHLYFSIINTNINQQIIIFQNMPKFSHILGTIISNIFLKLKDWILLT